MFRTGILLFVLSGIFLAVGFFLGGMGGMGIALVFTAFVNIISYWYSDSIVLRIYGAQLTDDKDLNEMARKLAAEAEIPKPRVYLMQSEVPNAFATGRDPSHGAVAVTLGLMKLSKGEMEAVIAHEMSHIKNRDTLVQAVAATIAGAISYLAMIGYWSMFSSDENRGSGAIIGAILIAIFAPLAATIVRLAISRRREYAADHEAALMTRKPANLASALRKISEMSRETPIRGPSATSHLWIVNPFKDDWFTGLFSTHPPISRRIEKLQRMSPARGG
ncbi:MAG: M48 family metalloprotease [Candidatus Aenigmatarchaeota archaeon]